MTVLTVAAAFTAVFTGVDAAIDALGRAGKVRRLSDSSDSDRGLCPRPALLGWLQRWLVGLHRFLPGRMVEQARVGLGLIDDADEELGWLQSVVCVCAVGGGLALAVIVRASWSSAVIIAVVSLVAGYVGPMWYLARKCRLRTGRAAAEMGEFLELTACCTEAGMPLLSTLELVSTKMSGIFALELRVALARSGALGGVAAGLNELSHRFDHLLIRTVISTLIQAERMGTPLAHLLRKHQRTVITMRRHGVLQRIADANNKLTLCAILLLLPATLAVAIIPNVIGLLHGQW